MSGESAPKPRLVLCPKCWQLLPESPNYDVYKCGGCGTTLQAKRRRSRAVNSESSTHETDAAPRNASDLVSDGKQYSNGEQLVSPQENGLKEKATSSSSGECSLEGNDGRVQTENGECNGEKLVTSQENGLRAKATGSSPGECSSEGDGTRGQIENGECNGEKTVNSQENGLREKATSSYTGQSSLDGNGGRGQIENGECNEEQQVISQENDLRAKATSSSSEESFLHGNGGKVQIENGECNEDQQVVSQENDLKVKATSSSSEECSLDGNGGRGQIENGKCNGEKLGPFNLSDEEPESVTDIYKDCSSELAHYEEIEASAELMADNLVEKANDTNLQLEEEKSNGNVPLEGEGEQLISALDIENANDEKSALVRVKSEGDIAGSDLQVEEKLTNGNLLLERAGHELISGSDGEDVNSDQLALVGSSPEADINGTSKAESEELNNGNLLLEETEKELNMCASDGEDPKNGQSALVGAKSEVDITGNVSTAKRLTTENFVSEKGSISHVAPCKLKEGTSGNHVSSKNIHHTFDHAKSVDFDNKELINPSSEISGKVGEFSKSPTTRSSHAYDGSVSSNDGLDERFPSQYLDSFENTYTAANGVSENVSRKGKGLVNSMVYGDLETQHQSYFPNRKHQVMQDSRRNQNEVPETTRNDHAHWMRTKKDEFPPKIPFHRSGSQSGYESGSPSTQTHDELYCSSSYLSPDSFDDPDQEKMKLLRMVYKLQYQLNKTSYAKGETDVRLSTGKHISPYQSHDFHEGRFYRGLDYPRWDGRCSQGINWHQRHNISQIPYLAEPTSSVLHVDHPCFNCCPQEWQCSGEFPPHVLYQHEELWRPHLGHSCCSSHHSYPSSPQWIKTSKLAHGRETKSCDQRHRAPEMKNYFREKPSLTKRHYRPVAGGAPFITCHKCLRLLQLPADFLLFKRVCHQLKCGACQEVLKFSLQNGSHIVSYGPNALVPLSSDLDDQNEVIDGIGSNPHSESHANHYHPSHADPVSYSDDYGHSVTKSYSPEGDPVSLTPLHALNDSVHHKPSDTHGTFEPMTEKEVIASRGPSTSKAPVQTDELAVRFSNVSSEIEARSLPKSSPLHQLMGYSSPSLVIRGVPSSVDGKEPILNDPSHNSQQS
ncbi:putative zinc-ribbon domain, plant [Sesbania bispinosa]|nr:putative zinc-ribbon domain, plant [Sesbania bispinosa]